MSLTSDELGHEESGPWPAFTDLLAATSLLFLVLFAAVAIPAIQQNGKNAEIRSAIDSLETRLQATAARDSSVSVRRVGDYLLVQIAESATFKKDQYALAELQPRGKRILRALADSISHGRADSLIDQVQVVGHASVEGAEELNWLRSAERAATISLFLIDSAGLDACKVSALGRSHFYPADFVDQRKLRTVDPRDRRIELEVRPLLPGDSLQRRRREAECVPDRRGSGLPLDPAADRK